MLELQSPLDGKASNITMVRRLFQEALLLEPKHGPAYNAFANLERRQGNVDEAKQIYQNGIRANCTDPSSVFHGLGKLLLSLGEVEEARNTLLSGLQLFKTKDSNTFVKRNENVAFLAHTLGLIELNCNNNPKAAKEILEQGLWHCRSSSQLLLGVALCESRLGNEQNAREMFEQAIKADESHAQAWQAFGVLEMRAGNYGSAKTLFECGLKNSPRHGALWQAYGKLNPTHVWCLLYLSPRH
jgi:tetratricopeptide (TPR) repeat protein